MCEQKQRVLPGCETVATSIAMASADDAAVLLRDAEKHIDEEA